MSVRPVELNLTHTRDVGDILAGAFRLYRRRFWLFATIAFAVVVPVDLLVYGVLGEMLWSDRDYTETLPLAAGIASVLAPYLILTPLITAGHVRAVMELAEGATPAAGAVLGAALRRLPVVAAGVVMAHLGATLGLLLLIVPGVYLYVAWLFTPQVIVAEGTGAIEGVSRSRRLVKGSWWRTFGVILLIYLVSILLAAVLGVPLLGAGALADSGPLTLLGQILLDGVTYSFTALAGTLLYFDMRAREQLELQPPPAPPGLDAPERPL